MYKYSDSQPMIQTSLVCNNYYEFGCAQFACIHQVRFMLIKTIKTKIFMTKMTPMNTKLMAVIHWRNNITHIIIFNISLSKPYVQ